MSESSRLSEEHIVENIRNILQELHISLPFQETLATRSLQDLRNLSEELTKIDPKRFQESRSSLLSIPLDNGLIRKSGDLQYIPCHLDVVQDAPQVSLKRLGFIILAGGQATRMKLPSHTPKALVPVTSILHKSLLQLFFEKALSYQYLSGTIIDIALFVSDSTHCAIESFLKKNGYFGFNQDHVSLMEQPSLPFLNEKGDVMCDEKGHLMMGPDGNGSLLYTMKKSKTLDAWKAKGVEYATVAQIDNPLLDPFYPPLLSSVLSHDLVFTAVKKNSETERVGLFVQEIKSPHIEVREYSELESFSSAIKPPYTLADFQWANISQCAFQISWADRVWMKPLPWHAAKKNSDGRSYFKMEQFFFDVLRYTETSTFLPINREMYFSPIKQEKGLDSLEEAKARLENKDREIFYSRLSTKTRENSRKQSLELHPFWGYYTPFSEEERKKAITTYWLSSGYMEPPSDLVDKNR